MSRSSASRAAASPPDEPAPSNTEAEQSLLGAILVNNRAHAAVADALYQEHFFDPVHGRIYAAVGDLIERGAEANPVTLRPLFERDPALAAVGGAQYLVMLVHAAVTVVNAPYYAELIVDAYRRRVLIAQGQEIIARASAADRDDPVDRQIEEAGSRLFDLGEIGAPQAGGRKRVLTLQEAAAEALDATQRAYREPGKIAGIGSGIAALDKIVGGFAGGDLIIGGGRPGAGKSSLMNSVTWAALEAGHAVHIFSGEMTSVQLAARLLAAISGISAGKQRRGDVTPSEWTTLFEAQTRVAAWPLVIDDGPLVLSRIRQQARAVKRRQSTRLVMIDYLQLMRGAGGDDDGISGGFESRNMEVGRISNALKRMAKALDVPIIALSQLSRRVEDRDDKRPMMSDLRNAGELEQDADVVMLLYRHETYLSKAEPQQRQNETEESYANRRRAWHEALEQSRGAAEIIVAKCRHDRTGTAHVRFDGERSFFHDPHDAQWSFL